LADEGLNVRLPHCSRGIFIRQSEIARHFPGPAAASKLSVEARHLFHIALKVSPPHVIGSTPYGERRIVPVPEGEFEGERLRGVVLNGGSDWILVRPDHVWALNVRLVLQTNEGDLIEMSYRGLRHGPRSYPRAGPSRRAGGSLRLLFSDLDLFRNRIRTLCLDEQDPRDRKWLPRTGRAPLPSV
jgi:Protein of unknown function (DUF3237)